MTLNVIIQESLSISISLPLIIITSTMSNFGHDKHNNPILLPENSAYLKFIQIHCLSTLLLLPHKRKVMAVKIYKEYQEMVSWSLFVFRYPLYTLRLFIYFQLLSEKVEGWNRQEKRNIFIFGLFYDLNKIFFCRFTSEKKKQLKTWFWWGFRGVWGHFNSTLLFLWC